MSIVAIPLAGIPWAQISGAVAGGLVGGFSGFVANNVHARRENRQAKRNVASALRGEIGAIIHLIEAHFTASDADGAEGQLRRRHFRGERDYMSIFRALGSHIGVLPAPLPHDLVAWYTALAMCLERAHELHELRLRRDPESFEYAMELVRLQEASLAELVELAGPLIECLKSF